MKKQLTTIFLLFLITEQISFVFLVNASEIKLSKKKIAIDIGHSPVHITYDLFETDYLESGNVVDEIENYTHIDDYDILLIPASKINYTSDEMTIIKTWFANADKLLWIAGDSDYAGQFISHKSINPLLEFLDSKLRLDSGAVSDLYSNDGTGYRVIATNPGTGTIGSVVNEGVERLLLHGPTAVYGMENGDFVDLRTETIEGIEVIFSYNDSAEMLDQDYSNTESDFYTSLDEKGNYPAVVYEDFGVSHLIVSGEVLFSSYKSMYGEEGEHGSAIQGKLFVNNLLNYFYKSKGLPFNFPIFVVSLSLISVVVFYLKQKRR
ncbi:MAG: hypothetical protein ACTSVB_06380 [Candidatus Heimdallarchaeaceae archaeon]|nr:MAG: hypothetical protein DRN69_06965 [Candidatus Pacearchaeota archaeon]